MVDFKGETTRVYSATADSTAVARIAGLKLEVQGFDCDVVTEVIPFIPRCNATLQASALWDPSGHAKYTIGEPFLRVLARTQAADVEYDFYERICGRQVGLDFGLVAKEKSKMSP